MRMRPPLATSQLRQTTTLREERRASQQRHHHAFVPSVVGAFNSNFYQFIAMMRQQRLSTSSTEAGIGMGEEGLVDIPIPHEFGARRFSDQTSVKEQALKLCTAPCFDHRKHAHAPCHTDDTVKVPLVAGVLAAVQRLHSQGSDISDDVLLDGLAFDPL